MTKIHNSAEIVAANEDILMEVLVRLPIKSLFRFKCVSIKWLHLICSRYFSHNHCLKNGTVSTTGLFLYQHPSLMHVSLRNDDPDSRPGFGPVQIFDFLKITLCATNLTILTSCGGLLLCLLVAPPGSDIDIVYIVCNPATKLSTALPPLENLAKKPIVNMDLAYDPRNSPHYSVVCMRNCNPPDGPEFQIQIFSSENGGWRDCAGPFYGFPPGMQFRGGVHWKKSIHYLNYWGGDSVYFDVETESLKSLPMPPRQRDTNTMKRSWYLGESGGHLHLVDVHTNIRSDSSIDIYELRGDYSGWFVRCRVNISAVEAAFPEMVQHIEAVPVLAGARRMNLGRYNKYYVLSVVQEEGEGSLEIVLSVPNRIIAFNPGNNRLKVLVYFRDDRDRALFEWHNLIHYSQTLAPA